MAFDVNGALQAGASEDDVLSHLSESRKFDVQGALKAGASKRDVIDHMAGMNPKSGFFGRIGENLTGMKDLAVGLATHPMDTAKSALTPDPAVAKEAADAFNRGDYGRAAASTVEDIPLIGPQIRRTEQDVRNKDYGAIAGDVATGVALSQVPRLARGVKAAAPIVKAAAKAGGADIAAGAAKTAVGYGVAKLPVPQPLKFGMGFELGREGVKQIGRGVRTGYKAGRAAMKEPPTPPAEVPPPEPPSAAPEAPPDRSDYIDPDRSRVFAGASGTPSQTTIPLGREIPPPQPLVTQQVMSGVEKQPPPAPPVGSDYMMPPPAPPEAAGPPNAGQPRLNAPPSMPPQASVKPEAPPPTAPPVKPPPTPPTLDRLKADVPPAEPSSALGAFGVEEPKTISRARIQALANDYGRPASEVRQMMRDEGYKIQDDPFASGEGRMNRRGKVTDVEPMKPETKVPISDTKPARLHRLAVQGATFIRLGRRCPKAHSRHVRRSLAMFPARGDSRSAMARSSAWSLPQESAAISRLPSR